MKKILTIILTVLIGIGLTVSLFAGKNHKKHSKHACKMFKMVDTNNDKQISKAEWASHFDKIDANKDGQITREEMKQQHKKHHKKHKKNH